ncbi:MAG: tol-pal system protein YbgF [Candidatus Latescibacteria bacterium]|nr:tol-pal system protein YbgF [Candidatus Latescibacterota bacterium]
MHLMSLRIVRGLTFIFLASLLAGCATSGAVKSVQSDVGRVEDQLHLLSRQVVSLDSLLQAQGAESHRVWVELSTDGDDVKQRVQRVEAKLDEAARRLADLSKALETVRLYSGGKMAPSEHPSFSSGSADTASVSALRRSLISDEQGIYDQASEDLKKENYPLAASGFSQLLENFPKSDLADDARYWLGECYYAQGDFTRAIEAFQRVITDYPDSEKVPAAMLKLGYAFLEVNDRTNGVQRLRELMKDYPKSEEAAQAKKRLRDLGTAPKSGTPKRR